jgi:nucleotidyltransferase/DNA polymerase involved in DNA repair
MQMGDSILKIISKHISGPVEKASIDEVYIDLSDQILQEAELSQDQSIVPVTSQIFGDPMGELLLSSTEQLFIRAGHICQVLKILQSKSFATFFYREDLTLLL